MNTLFTKFILICAVAFTIGFMPARTVQAVFTEIVDGCSPDFWKDNTAEWTVTGFLPGQSVQSVFSKGFFLWTYKEKSLLQAVISESDDGAVFDRRGQAKEAARILIRAAVAALLNSAHPEVDFPPTTSEVINEVNTALASHNRDTILALAAELEFLNEELFRCPLEVQVTEGEN